MFTTCATSAVTWADEMPAGTSELHGVTVHRFPSVSGRDPAYGRLVPVIGRDPDGVTDELAHHFVDLVGPVCPDVIDAAEQSDNDLVAVTPYLFWPAVHAVPRLGRRVLFHGAAHDEAELHLRIMRPVFRAVGGFAFFSFAERSLVERTFPVAHLPSSVIGATAVERDGDPAAARAALGLGPDEPFVLCVGRVERVKGAHALAEMWQLYRRRRPGVPRLVLLGPVNEALVGGDDVVVAGRHGEAVKWGALKSAQLVVTPSAFESFSLVVVEAWLAGRAVVVNGRCRGDGGGVPAQRRRAVVLRLRLLRGADGPFARRRRPPGAAGHVRRALRPRAVRLGRHREPLRRPRRTRPGCERLGPIVVSPAKPWQPPGAIHLGWRWLACLLVLAAALPVTIDPPYANGPPIRSDGIGYHAWTRALLGEGPRLLLPGVGSGGFHLPPWWPAGSVSEQVSPGLALLRFPVMALLVDTDPGAPLVSEAEHRASLYCSAFALLLVCVVATATCHRLRLGTGCTQLAVLTMVFGTGLFHYGTYDGSFTHVYSALGVAVLIWLGVRAGKSRLVRIASALTAFLLVATRFTNIIAVVVLLLAYLAWTRKGEGIRWADAAAVMLGVGVAVGLQCAYNLYATGHLALSSYGDEGFQFAETEQLQVALLVPARPVRLVSRRRCGPRDRPGGPSDQEGGIVVRGHDYAVYAGLYGFWRAGSLGGFGNRGFVELVPAGMVLFAFALDEHRLRGRAVIALTAIVATLMTVELMSGYWRNTIPYTGGSPDTYWSHVVGRESWLP